jgi:hypothetical protein
MIGKFTLVESATLLGLIGILLPASFGSPTTVAIGDLMIILRVRQTCYNHILDLFNGFPDCSSRL